jgi:hypothetical protein
MSMALIAQTRHGGAHRFPDARIGSERAAQIDDGIDMRVGLEQGGRQFPARQESEIVQLELAVRAEHGDALPQRVERLALDARLSLELRGEPHALGRIVEQVGDPSLRVRRGDDA